MRKLNLLKIKIRTSGMWLLLGLVSLFLTLDKAFAGAGANENMLVNPYRQELLPEQGASIDPHAGRNGTPGLILSRYDEKVYTYYEVPVEGVKPSGKYRFGAWIKTKDLKPGYRGATMTVNFYHDDGNAYDAERPFPYGFVGTRDWTFLEHEVTAPAKFHHVTVSFYIGYSGLGEAVFSEPFLTKMEPFWATTLIYPALRFGIEPGKHTFEFNSYPQNLEGDQAQQVQVDIVDAQGMARVSTVAPIVNNRYSVDAELPEGNYVAKLTLLPAGLKSELKMNVVKPREQARVTVDGRGRFFANGKPFLPVGIYTNMEQDEFKQWGNKWRESDTELLIEKSPFNVILPYDGFWWKLENPELTDFEATAHMLDIFQKHNKMLILSLKDFHPKRIDNKYEIQGALNITKAAVERFRNHPALLGWCLNDESEVQDYEREQAEAVGMLDPHHPSIQVQFRPNLQFSALNGGDIFGIDIYPIRLGDSNQRDVCDIFQSLHDSFGSSHGTVVLAVPQAFSWYAYSDRCHKYKPTLPQMRAVALMMAVYGARSFVFYAHQGMLKMTKAFGIPFEELWQEGCQLGQMLRDLEDYLLGDALPATPPLDIKEGNPRVQVLTANSGRQAVMITTVGDTKATEVEFQLDPARRFFSKYGHTTPLGEGKYRFTCEYLDCDVLEEIADQNE